MIRVRLNEILEEKNLTINKVSQESGVSRPSLTALVNNESGGVQFETLEKLTNYLNVSISDIFVETKQKVTFAFFSDMPLKSVRKVEEMPTKMRNDGFVEFSPSQMFSFTGVITENEKIGETFKIFVTPVIEKNELFTLLFSLTRYDSNGNQEPTKDLEKFLAKLSPEAIIRMCDTIFFAWGKYYSEVSDLYEMLQDILLINIAIVNGTAKIPVIANVQKKRKGKGILLDYDLFEKNTPANGDPDYSKSIEFKFIEDGEIQATIQKKVLLGNNEKD